MGKTNKKQQNSEASFSSQEHLACEKEIRRRAYELWEASGGRQGEDVPHWLLAENEVLTGRLAKNG